MEKTRQVLERHVNEIIHLESDIFPLTTDEKKCQFCRYRSLCERGISAGNLNDLEEDEDEIGGEININFDEIEGIAF